MSGSGKQKALALIGDRLLDLKLYELLLSSGEEREGWMTQKRSMLVSNENLSRCGSDLLVPSVLSRKEFNLLSTHEKGTLVEAYLGVLYVQEKNQITSALNEIVNHMILTLQSYLNHSDDISSSTLSHSSSTPHDPSSLSTTPGISSSTSSSLLLRSQYKPPADRKKAKSTLLEVLQKRGVTKATTFFTTWSIETPNFPPFVSKFEPNFDLIHCNLPDPGPVIGEICPSKKDAEESVAAKVLQFFRDRELMVFAPEQIQHISPSALNPPSLPEQVYQVAQKFSTYEVMNGMTDAVYDVVEVDAGVKITTVTGGNLDEILNKSREDYLRHCEQYNLSSSSSFSSSSPSSSPCPSSPSLSSVPTLVDLPESLPLSDAFYGSQKRLLDPKKWHLCSNDSLSTPSLLFPTTLTSSSSSFPLTSTPTTTIFDGPYLKKYRSQSDRHRHESDETEEGEIVLEEEELNLMITQEREEENKRIRENLIAVRKARVLAEKKKLANFRKFASRKRE
jgi:23S rRNA maturation mini-RNase III